MLHILGSLPSTKDRWPLLCIAQPCPRNCWNWVVLPKNIWLHVSLPSGQDVCSTYLEKTEEDGGVEHGKPSSAVKVDNIV